MQLTESVGDDALSCQKAHEAQKLRLRQRPLLGDPDELRNRLLQRIVLIALRISELDGHGGIRAWRQLAQHLTANAAYHAAGQALAQGVEVPRPADFLAAVRVRRVPWNQPPLRFQSEVVDPVEQ